MPVISKITGAPFRFWCQKILPAVYDDSLSYYELLCKVVDYLNKVMEDDINVVNLVNELEEFVNNYFDNLDVQEEINNKLDAMAEDGSLLILIEPYLQPIVDQLHDDYSDFTEEINTQIEQFNAEMEEELSDHIEDVTTSLNEMRADISEQDNDISVMQSQMSNFIDSHSDIQTFTTLFEETEQNGGHYEGQSITLSDAYTDYTELDIYWSFLGDVRVTRVASADVLANGVVISWFADSPALQPSNPAPLNIPLMSLTNGNTDHTALTISTAYAETWSGLSTDSAVRNAATTSTDYDAGSIIKIIGVDYQASAELQDIRVGFDGTVYPTAGDSTRAQAEYLFDSLYTEKISLGRSRFIHSTGLSNNGTENANNARAVSLAFTINVPVKIVANGNFLINFYDVTNSRWVANYSSVFYLDSINYWRIVLASSDLTSDLTASDITSVDIYTTEYGKKQIGDFAQIDVDTTRRFPSYGSDGVVRYKISADADYMGMLEKGNSNKRASTRPFVFPEGGKILVGRQTNQQLDIFKNDTFVTTLTEGMDYTLQPNEAITFCAYADGASATTVIPHQMMFIIDNDKPGQLVQTVTATQVTRCDAFFKVDNKYFMISRAQESAYSVLENGEFIVEMEALDHTPGHANNCNYDSATGKVYVSDWYNPIVHVFDVDAVQNTLTFDKDIELPAMPGSVEYYVFDNEKQMFYIGWNSDNLSTDRAYLIYGLLVKTKDGYIKAYEKTANRPTVMQGMTYQNGYLYYIDNTASYTHLNLNRINLATGETEYNKSSWAGTLIMSNETEGLFPIADRTFMLVDNHGKLYVGVYY